MNTKNNSLEISALSFGAGDKKNTYMKPSADIISLSECGTLMTLSSGANVDDTPTIDYGGNASTNSITQSDSKGNSFFNENDE